MRYLTPLISDARGKLGGTVYSRNPYGPYTRAKTAPLQPRTPSQQAGRQLFATAATSWRALSADARAAWRNYAAALSKSDSLGRRYNPSGFQTYLTHYRFAQAMGATSPPTPPPRGTSPTPVNYTLDAWISTGTGDLTIALEPQAPFTFAGGNYIPQATPGQSPSITFVPRQTYRNLAPAFNKDPVLGYWHAEFDYLQVFPSPSVGDMLWMRIRSANRFTGLVSSNVARSVVVRSVP